MESIFKPAKLSYTLTKFVRYRYLLADIRIPLSASNYRYLPSTIYYDTYVHNKHSSAWNILTLVVSTEITHTDNTILNLFIFHIHAIVVAL